MLDYEVVKKDGTWFVWTPDTTGAVLGSGPSAYRALADAVKNMEECVEAIQKSPAQKFYPASRYQPLFDYLSDLGLTALESEMQEVERIVKDTLKDESTTPNS